MMTRYVGLFALVLFGLTSAAAGDQLVLFGPTAFSLADPKLNSSDLAKFNYGRGLFHHEWKVHEHADGTQSGLGPLFSANSCASCHVRDGRGQAPAQGSFSPSFVIAVGIPSLEFGTRSDKIYGSQIQVNGVGTPPEAIVRVTYITTTKTMATGDLVELQHPVYEATDLAYGELEPEAKLSGRLPQALIGLGFLETVPEETLAQNADPFDLNKDGISGRISFLANGEIGRFGWKAETPTVLHQTSKAASGDMGISTPLFSAYAGDCTQFQPQCLQASLTQPENKTTELDGNEARILALYSANLAVPPRRRVDNDDVLAGEKLFQSIGCQTCHVAKFDQEQEFAPAYTDLLLHDMGNGLRDPAFGDTELAQEWRTPPLWGLGYTKEVNGNENYLHDGRARTLTEAILWHDGEAASSKEDFRSLELNERNQLLSFLNSL
ncbi:di-heme oxidoredictase family protein [uncultured Maritalea sp.]|uniref:di-heme oxidoredictase family protein n=1 Tax=uncultured Maritalea sp. TaxID=757249 RepID=UPI002634AEEC|nr:di-heme oxidoredictase family protein [uncultured Maritalea sp.]